MLKIFISYRRADTLAFAGRIGDRLRAKYGVKSVYIDQDTIPPGVDFRDHIIAAVKDCDVFLALIGERWAPVDSSGRSCLQDKSDFVRIEVEVALSRNIPVIPVLVGKAALPREADLPSTLAPLVYRNAFHIDEGPDFHHHIDRLIRLLKESIKSSAAVSAPTLPIAAAPSQTASADVEKSIDVLSKGTPGEILAGLDSRAPPSPDHAPNLAPINLTVLQGLSLTAFLLMLNSILAALGSMLWEDVHYWPAYMVSSLACAYFRYWGLVVAVLSPIVSSLLMIGGAPAYLYLPSNAIQGILVIAAMVLLGIDPSLARLQDKVKYILGAIISPSIVGASLAWFLRRQTGIGAQDSQFAIYVFYWVVENLLPVLFPGLWLHAVVGSLRQPFGWHQRSYLTGWVGLTLEHAAPWIVTLFLSVSITLFLVSSRLGERDLSLDAWSQIHRFAGTSYVFGWLVLATSISILISVGMAVRHARQAWQLEQAIRRHMPRKEEADRILSGLVSPSKNRTVSLIVFRLTNLGDAARSLRPQVLVGWLNAYFDCLCASAQRFGGYVDHFNAANTLVVFGSLDEDSHANSSLMFAMDAALALRQFSTKLAERDAPGFAVAMGIHTGPVVSGEVGSVDRRHYAVVGDTVNVVTQISREAEDIADRAFPVLLSVTTVRDAGLFARLERVGLEEASVVTGGFEPLQLYAIMDPTLLKQALILEATRSI